MSDATCYSFSREELLSLAREHMIWLYGNPNISGDTDRWMERFGLLVGFVDTLTKKNDPIRESR